MMLNFGRLFLVTLFSVFFCVQAVAQQIESVISRYASEYKPERIYIHYDKSSYVPGETIWFKAYMMEGILPAEGSKTMYIDWVAENGTVLQHHAAPVVDASTNGQFEIPASYAGQVLHVRAYTKWMLNFDSSFLYQKNISILNKRKGSVNSSIPPTLHFFPEGGEAVAGIESKIAFKAVGHRGLPINIRGVIQKSNGTQIDSFMTIHDGMGFFYLLPEAGTVYTALWKDENGIAHSTPLPEVKPQGVTLLVKGSGSSRQFSIRSTDDQNAGFHIIGTMHGHLVFKTSRKLSAKTAGGIIPVSSLPSGILTITVFDEKWNALAERVTFINNEEYRFEPTMEVKHWGLNKRARNEIEIFVPDSLSADLSISVTDVMIDADSSTNIISELLLSGEIRGRVHKPAYYFSGRNEMLAEHLDLVMLTHGWRRFKWEDIAKAKYPEIKHPRDTTWLSMAGRLIGPSPAQLSGAGDIVLLVKGSDTSLKMMVVPIEADGSFHDPGFIFFDTIRVYYQLPKNKGLNNATVRFMQNRFNTPVYKDRFRAGFSTDTSGQWRHMMLANEMIALLESFKGKTLENVTVTARTKTVLEEMNEKYSSGFFKSSDAYQFDLVNDITAGSRIDIFSYLQGKVPGLQIRQVGGEVGLDWRGATPSLYLDELNVDAELLSSVPTSDIAYVKIFRPPFMGAPGGGSGGAIAVYTRKGDDERRIGKGLDNNTIAGYTPIREFYSPNYDRFDKQHEQPDLRTTLYWNPRLVTSPGKNSVVLRFYNNDTAKAFRVVIEGMTKDGRLAHFEQVME